MAKPMSKAATVDHLAKKARGSPVSLAVILTVMCVDRLPLSMTPTLWRNFSWRQDLGDNSDQNLSRRTDGVWPPSERRAVIS